MSWQEEIKKEEKISDIITLDLHKLGSMLVNSIEELTLDEGEEYYLGRDRVEKVKKLRRHLDDALDVVEELIDR